MDIYSLHLQTIARLKGRSGVGAWAYRAGECLIDPRTGEIFDFSGRAGVEAIGVVGFARDEGETESTRAARLWAEACKAERRRNSVEAREIMVALPQELDTKEKRRAAALQITEAVCRRYGCAASFAIHSPSGEGDERNYHVHIMFTTRRVIAEREFGKKTRELDDWSRSVHPTTGRSIVRGRFEVEWIRAKWQQVANRALRREGAATRLDRRSYAEQDAHMPEDERRVPTRHLGPKHTAHLRKVQAAIQKEPERRVELEEALEHNRLIRHNRWAAEENRRRAARTRDRVRRAAQQVLAGLAAEAARALFETRRRRSGLVRSVIALLRQGRERVHADRPGIDLLPVQEPSSAASVGDAAPFHAPQPEVETPQPADTEAAVQEPGMDVAEDEPEGALVTLESMGKDRIKEIDREELPAVWRELAPLEERQKQFVREVTDTDESDFFSRFDRIFSDPAGARAAFRANPDSTVLRDSPSTYGRLQETEYEGPRILGFPTRRRSSANQHTFAQGAADRWDWLEDRRRRWAAETADRNDVAARIAVLRDREHQLREEVRNIQVSLAEQREQKGRERSGPRGPEGHGR